MTYSARVKYGLRTSLAVARGRPDGCKIRPSRQITSRPAGHFRLNCKIDKKTTRTAVGPKGATAEDKTEQQQDRGTYREINGCTLPAGKFSGKNVASDGCTQPTARAPQDNTSHTYLQHWTRHVLLSVVPSKHAPQGRYCYMSYKLIPRARTKREQTNT